MTIGKTKPVPDEYQKGVLQNVAKAAGIELAWSAPDGFKRYDNQASWNPIADNGDALELAEKLHILFYVDSTGAGANLGLHRVYETYHDVLPALRRAIVGVASMIAKEQASKVS